jgi:hypothetical protein
MQCVAVRVDGTDVGRSCHVKSTAGVRVRHVYALLRVVRRFCKRAEARQVRRGPGLRLRTTLRCANARLAAHLGSRILQIFLLVIAYYKYACICVSSSVLCVCLRVCVGVCGWRLPPVSAQLLGAHADGHSVRLWIPDTVYCAGCVRCGQCVTAHGYGGDACQERELDVGLYGRKWCRAGPPRRACRLCKCARGQRDMQPTAHQL